MTDKLGGKKNINLRSEGSRRYIRGIRNAIIQLMQDVCERNTGTQGAEREGP